MLERALTVKNEKLERNPIRERVDLATSKQKKTSLLLDLQMGVVHIRHKQLFAENRIRENSTRG